MCCCWHSTVQPGAVRGGKEFEKKQREKIRAYNDLEKALADFVKPLEDVENAALGNPVSVKTAVAVQEAQASWQKVEQAIQKLASLGLATTHDQDRRIANLKGRLDRLVAYVQREQQKERKTPQQRQRAASAPAVLATPVAVAEAKQEENPAIRTVKTGLADLSNIDREQKLYVEKWIELGWDKKGPKDFKIQYATRQRLLNQQKDSLLKIKRELLDLEQFSANEKNWADKFHENKRLLCFNEIDHEILNVTKEIDALKSSFKPSKGQKAKEIREKIELLKLNAKDSSVALQALEQKEQALNQIVKTPKKSTLRRPQQVVTTFTQQSEDDDRAKNFASNIFTVQRPEKKQQLIESFITNVRKLAPERQEAILKTVQKINFELALTLEDALKQTTTDVIWELNKINRDQLKYAEAKAQAEAKLLLEAIQKQAPTIEALAENIENSNSQKNIQGLYTIMLDLQKTMLTNKARLDALARQWRTPEINNARDQVVEVLGKSSQLITEARLKVERLQK